MTEETKDDKKETPTTPLDNKLTEADKATIDNATSKAKADIKKSVIDDLTSLKPKEPEDTTPVVDPVAIRAKVLAEVRAEMMAKEKETQRAAEQEANTAAVSGLKEQIESLKKLVEDRNVPEGQGRVDGKNPFDKPPDKKFEELTEKDFADIDISSKKAFMDARGNR